MTRSEWASTSSLVAVRFHDGLDAKQSAADTAIWTSSDDFAGTSSSETGQRYAAIKIPQHLASSAQRGRPCLVLPVIRGDSSHDQIGQSDNVNTSPTLLLPPMARQYFNRLALADLDSYNFVICSHKPVALSSLVLAATSKTAYDYARHSQQVIEGALHQVLLRQDDVVSLGSSAFRAVLCEPVLQGIFEQGHTKVHITLDEQGAISAAAETDVDELERNMTDFAIDERFLAEDVLDDFDSEEEGYAKHSMVNDRQAQFRASAVQDRRLFDDALSHAEKRVSSDGREVDEETIILLEESGLAALGAFEGDWALAYSGSNLPPKLVRLFIASASSSAYASTSQDTLPVAHLSPILLQNLQSTRAADQSAIIRLQVLPSQHFPADFKSKGPQALDCPLPIPFADSLTIARIAGPYSINRQYQPLFLAALRSHFEGRKRILRKGDLIAVAFDKGRARWMTTQDNQGENGEADSHVAESIDLRLPNDADERDTLTAIVHFQVTDVTPELTEPTPLDSSERRGSEEAQVLEQARMGELGCVVDTALTKMIQTGVGNARVPNATGWLDILTDTPALTLSSPLCRPGSVYDQIGALVQAMLSPQAANYGLHLTALVKGARQSGKTTVVRWVAQQAGIQLMEMDCFDLLADTDARTEGILRARFEQASSCAPAILLLQHVDALARKSQALETGQEPMMATVLQDCIHNLQEAATTHLPVSVFATTSNVDRCPLGILKSFKHEFNLEAPSEAERYSILESCLGRVTVSADVDLDSLATQTAALVAGDLADLVKRAQMASIARVGEINEADDTDIVAAGLTLTGVDFDVALNKARLNYSENIGAPKIPNVTWDDVGGLVSVKDDILDTIQLPLEHPELFTDGLKKRSGILLYGPPGTGKTLLAKAVATSCSLNFFSVKGPELLNMYIGESEANVRRVFQRARDAKPCVIFFDELDSIAPKRGNQGDSGGVMDRIVSQLLAELDGMSGSDGGGGEVFVIGATNRPDLLDPALLRPGRFDRMLYLSVSETHADQLNILQALTRKFTLDDDVGDLGVIAEQCPFNLTGADFYALCSDAMLKSMTRKASLIDEEIQRLNSQGPAPMQSEGGKHHPYPLTTQYYLDEMADPSDLTIKVNRQDFESALNELMPSVSLQEMQHYRQVQAKFSAPVEETAKNGSEVQTSNGALNGMTMADVQEMMREQASRTAPHSNGYTIYDEQKASLNGPILSPPARITEEAVAEPVADIKAMPVDGSGNGSGNAKGKGKGKGKGKARAV